MKSAFSFCICTTSTRMSVHESVQLTYLHILLDFRSQLSVTVTIDFEVYYCFAVTLSSKW